MTRSVRALVVVLVATSVMAAPRPAAAYSVLAHETMIDAVWDDVIAPMLARRYPQASAEDIRNARAYAYGGSVIQDLGYYPFGSHLFTNLVHYVRSGDFVEALVRDAQNVDDFAFALGALAHYASDNEGHPIAVNRSVPLLYPKLRAKYGDRVTYVEDPRRHIMVEFAFDVVQVAGGAYLPDSYRSFIGFEVAKPLLERAFTETYGLELKDLFADEDLAIGTYRYAVGQMIPEITRAAWKDKQDEIRRAARTVPRDSFIYQFTRQDYERAYGTTYRRPGVLARFLTFVFNLLPKVGPLKTLAFRPPTPETEQLFAESFRAARDRYRMLLRGARAGRIDLANTDFDTGRLAVWGEYPLADRTYTELLDKLSDRRFANVPPGLRSDVMRYFAAMDERTLTDKKARRRAAAVRRELATLATN
jgi:hypothetical protein